jgi:hypothetical protein
VLIYFSREEQENILHRFAAALPVGGILVLGRPKCCWARVADFAADAPASESIGGNSCRMGKCSGHAL